MNFQHSDSDDAVDPEPLLARGLRGTTPEFEARLDALRRRLASEPMRVTFRERLARAMRHHRVLIGATVAAAIALTLAVLHRSGPGEAIGLREEQRWYADVRALDDSLRDGTVLADAEAREILSSISSDDFGGGS